MFFVDLLFYGYIKRSYDRHWQGHFYVLKAFAFALFLNFTTLYLVVKQYDLFNLLSYDYDAWGFGGSGVLGALITFLLDRRKSVIINKFKKQGFSRFIALVDRSRCF